MHYRIAKENAEYGQVCRINLNGFIQVLTPVSSLLETQDLKSIFKSHQCSRNQISCVKNTEKSYNAATQTAKPRQVRTAQNSHRRKVSNAVPVIWSGAVRESEVLPWPRNVQFVTATANPVY
jgi:hypothetical protein